MSTMTIDRDRLTPSESVDYDVAHALARVINANMDALTSLGDMSGSDPFNDTRDILHRKRIEAAEMLGFLLLPDQPCN